MDLTQSLSDPARREELLRLRTIEFMVALNPLPDENVLRIEWNYHPAREERFTSTIFPLPEDKVTPAEREINQGAMYSAAYQILVDRGIKSPDQSCSVGGIGFDSFRILQAGEARVDKGKLKVTVFEYEVRITYFGDDGKFEQARYFQVGDRNFTRYLTGNHNAEGISLGVSDSAPTIDKYLLALPTIVQVKPVNPENK